MEKQFPIKITLVKDLPPFTKGTEFTLNKEKNKYESTCVIPYLNGMHEEVDKVEIYTCFDINLFDFSRSSFMTKEEYDNKKFNEQKIYELQNLIKKLEQL